MNPTDDTRGIEMPIRMDPAPSVPPHLAALMPRLARQIAELGGEEQASLADGAVNPATSVKTPPSLLLPDGRVNTGRFTDRARKCLLLARECCRELGHSHMGTGHLLAGIAREGSGIGGHVLREVGLSVEVIVAHLAEAPGRWDGLGGGETVSETPALTRALVGATIEALRLTHNHVGTEHLLLSLARDVSCYANRLCELCCVSAHLVVEKTLLLCAPEAVEVATSQANWRPQMQSVTSVIEALRAGFRASAGERLPAAAAIAALDDMERAVAKFRSVMQGAGPDVAECEDSAGRETGRASLMEVIGYVRAEGCAALWHGKIVAPLNRHLWEQVLDGQIASLNRFADAEGCGGGLMAAAQERRLRAGV